jgi:hypothetical protein
MSSQLRPARASALLAASTGPMPKTSGSTPCTPVAATRASGARPIRSPASSSPISSIDAPSLSGELLPAVTVPSLTNAAFSVPSFSSDVSVRMPSSRSSATFGTGTTSVSAPSS